MLTQKSDIIPTQHNHRIPFSEKGGESVGKESRETRNQAFCPVSALIQWSDLGKSLSLSKLVFSKQQNNGFRLNLQVSFQFKSSIIRTQSYKCNLPDIIRNLKFFIVTSDFFFFFHLKPLTGTKLPVSVQCKCTLIVENTENVEQILTRYNLKHSFQKQGY